MINSEVEIKAIDIEIENLQKQIVEIKQREEPPTQRSTVKWELNQVWDEIDRLFIKKGEAILKKPELNEIKKIRLLGDTFRGLWQVNELTSKARRCAGLKEFIVQWSVTFKYEGDLVETPGHDTMAEALDYAIEFLGLNDAGN